MQSDNYCSFEQKMMCLWVIKAIKLHDGHQAINTICHLDANNPFQITFMTLSFTPFIQ